MKEICFTLPEIFKFLQLKPECQKDAIKFVYWVRQKYPEYKLVVAETYRSPARQNKLYKKGKNATTLRGGQSKHQKGKAMDLYFVDRKRILRVDEAPYFEIAKEWVKRGHIAGYFWKVPFDPGHFEFP